MKAKTTRAPAALLRELETIRTEYGPGAARRKRALLSPLARLALLSARDVERLHETLCFLEAFPDGAPLLADVRRLLATFDRRADLRRFRKELADTGIAGTDTFYPFYYPTALWLARRWGDRLQPRSLVPALPVPRVAEETEHGNGREALQHVTPVELPRPLGAGLRLLLVLLVSHRLSPPEQQGFSPASGSPALRQAQGTPSTSRGEGLRYIVGPP